MCQYSPRVVGFSSPWVTTPFTPGFFTRTRAPTANRFLSLMGNPSIAESGSSDHQSVGIAANSAIIDIAGHLCLSLAPNTAPGRALRAHFEKRGNVASRLPSGHLPNKLVKQTGDGRNVPKRTQDRSRQTALREKRACRGAEPGHQYYTALMRDPRRQRRHLRICHSA